MTQGARLPGARCPRCGEGLTDAPRSCPACGAAHHAHCWSEGPCGECGWEPQTPPRAGGLAGLLGALGTFLLCLLLLPDGVPRWLPWLLVLGGAIAAELVAGRSARG